MYVLVKYESKIYIHSCVKFIFVKNLCYLLYCCRIMFVVRNMFINGLRSASENVLFYLASNTF